MSITERLSNPRWNSAGFRRGVTALAALAGTAGLVGPLMPTPVAAGNPASATTSSVTTSTTGDGALYVTVTLNDANGLPVSGKLVELMIRSQKKGTIDPGVVVSGNDVSDSAGRVVLKLTDKASCQDYGQALDLTDNVTLTQRFTVSLPTSKH